MSEMNTTVNVEEDVSAFSSLSISSSLTPSSSPSSSVPSSPHDLSILIITSPFRLMPSTHIIDICIESLAMIEGLEHCPIHIVLDGYNVSKKIRLKKAQIKRKHVPLYDRYYDNLCKKYVKKSPDSDGSASVSDGLTSVSGFSGGRAFHIHRMSEHHGFGLSVKKGLELCTTKYVLICQHDRTFYHAFSRLPDLIKTMEGEPLEPESEEEEEEETSPSVSPSSPSFLSFLNSSFSSSSPSFADTIRYIGFPTLSNLNHDKTLTCLYHLPYLNFKPAVKRVLPRHLFLQPLIFWYDSQHLVHRERYLEIFYPKKFFEKFFITLEDEVQRREEQEKNGTNTQASAFSSYEFQVTRADVALVREHLDLKLLRLFYIKRGDFIEDKWGQQQRNVLTRMNQDPRVKKLLVLRLFQYFGSYLAWLNPGEERRTREGPGDEEVSKNSDFFSPMVGHMDARNSTRYVKEYDEETQQELCISDNGCASESEPDEAP